MGKPVPKYHQAVRGEFCVQTFVTSLCDVGHPDRLVDDLHDVPRENVCLACSRRIPWAGSHEPVVRSVSDIDWQGIASFGRVSSTNGEG